MAEHGDGPLAGLRVIDLGTAVAGPFASTLLADFGAEVIKVEPLTGDWARKLGPPFVNGTSGFFIGLNRNKKSLDHPCQ
jgi:crotonobetainyl-CoA:carnitine CoA-transferase CaiB-like acyl-CoA transferase